VYLDGFYVIGIITGNFTSLVLIEPKNSCHLLMNFAYCCEHKLASCCKNHGTKMLIATLYHGVTEDRVREGIIG
jgi:hypothetical protein